MRTIAEEQTELAGRLRLVIVRAARRLRQQAGDELTPTLAAALGTIERHGPMSPSELADHERVRRPTATRIIARLADEGLIERADDPVDGRSSSISISTGGARLLRRLRGRKHAYLSRRLRNLDPDEIATLERATAILERALEREPR